MRNVVLQFFIKHIYILSPSCQAIKQKHIQCDIIKVILMDGPSSYCVNTNLKKNEKMKKKTKIK